MDLYFPESPTRRVGVGVEGKGRRRRGRTEGRTRRWTYPGREERTGPYKRESGHARRKGTLPQGLVRVSVSVCDSVDLRRGEMSTSLTPGLSACPKEVRSSVQRPGV